VDYDENWLNMLADRNLVVHLYEEEMADEHPLELEKLKKKASSENS